MPFEKLYERTGIQFQPFNTIYQLYEDMLRKRTDCSTDFLMIPEYLNYIMKRLKKNMLQCLNRVVENLFLMVCVILDKYIRFLVVNQG